LYAVRSSGPWWEEGNNSNRTKKDDFDFRVFWLLLPLLLAFSKKNRQKCPVLHLPCSALLVIVVSSPVKDSAALERLAPW
jgi:hypothetical protein